MRSLLATALAAAGVLVGCSSAFAQTMGGEVYTGTRDKPDRYDARRAGPRVYGYYQDEVSGRVLVRPGNCGEFRYWDGTRCADARVDPPNIR